MSKADEICLFAGEAVVVVVVAGFKVLCGDLYPIPKDEIREKLNFVGFEYRVSCRLVVLLRYPLSWIQLKRSSLVLC